MAAKITAFDIYMETSLRYFVVLHAQQQLDLIARAEKLALEMAEDIGMRVERGGALVSELHLAELEISRIGIEVDAAERSLANAKTHLAAMWGGTDFSRPLKIPHNQLDIPPPGDLEKYIDHSREAAEMQLEHLRLDAELALSQAETRPDPAIRAGYKRLMGEEVGSFLFGLSIPLPLFDRNQGRQAMLRSEILATESDMVQTKHETAAEIETLHRQLTQLKNRIETLTLSILPKVDTTYQSLRQAYTAGKIPYTSVLDAERTMIDLQSGHNDAILEFRQQRAALESILGIRFEHLSRE